ncbi:secretin N-terminal domain-containing protein [Bremerella volcania]|nr:secretin N-terminal domain-containing protein [Bremerella volcania]
MTRLLVGALVVAVSGVLSYPVYAQEQTPARPVYAQEQTPARSTESYPINPEKLDGLTSVMKQLFNGNPDVVIHGDKSSGKLVVNAPKAVQTQIAEFVKQSGYQTQARPVELNSSELRVRTAEAQTNVAPPKPLFQRSKDLGDGLVELEIKLNNLRGETLESGIAKLVGKRIPVSISAEGAMTMMTLPTNSEKKVSLQVYRNEGTAILRGESDSARSWGEVIRALDTPSHSDAYRTTLVSLRNASRDNVEKALDPLRDAENSLAKKQVFEALKDVAGKKKLRWSGDLAAMIFQPEPEQQPAADNANDDDNAAQIIGQPQGGQPIEIPDQPNPNNPQFTISPEEDGGLIGPVQIEFLEGLDVIVVRGHRRDVERITNIINDIERLSVETQPVIEVRELLHANSEAVATMVNELYENLLNARYGQVSITALNKPNAILVIGRAQSVEGILELIDKLDQPVGPAKTLKVFPLQNLAAAEAQTKLGEFYAEPTALGTRIRITSDVRSNSLIVAASPRDMVEIDYLLKQIDVPTSESTLKLEIVQLRNSVAEELAPILQEAITGTPATGGNQQQNQSTAQVRAAMLSFMTLDTEGKQILKSGILNEVTVTADTRSNALIIKAPEHSMELVLALVKHLDSQPSAESQIKVFTIVNGDATQLSTMLNELFQTVQSANSQARQTNAFFTPQATSTGESSLIPLNFTVDTRTNSIIASGSATDLTVVEAILLRLDQDEVTERKSTVVRLRNARADLVAESLTALLSEESQLQTLDPSVVSPFQQLVREVIVVPELFSNSLIISATPRYFDQVLEIVRELDERPPMVMLQVLIADVRLNDLEELGFELGLQDSVLFDRSVVSSGSLDPGYNWNNQTLGNSSSAASLATASAVGSQGLTNFALGRVNNDLGYGGFVFSAASESVNILVRALERESRLEVLARPQIMTMDNQPGFIQVGERVPYITSTQQTVNGTINTTELINTGIILSVTPRISPDGVVVMALQAERSAVGSEANGIPISINQNGDVIRSPRIDTQTATAVVSARSGQTIVFGGLISNSSEVVNRQVPLLGDVPLLGRFFRYDSYNAQRSELLIIITPIVVRSDEDAAYLKEQEMCRMSWCLADVAKVYGPEALYGIDPSMPMDDGIIAIHPDENPAGIPEVIPPGYNAPILDPPRGPLPPPNQQLPRMGSPGFKQPPGGTPRPSVLQPVEVRPVNYQQNYQAMPPQVQPGQSYPQQPPAQQPQQGQFSQYSQYSQPSMPQQPVR